MVQQNRGIDNGLLAGHRMDMENWKRRMPWYGSRADRIPCTGSAGLSEDGSQSHTRAQWDPSVTGRSASAGV